WSGLTALAQSEAQTRPAARSRIREAMERLGRGAEAGGGRGAAGTILRPGAGGEVPLPPSPRALRSDGSEGANGRRQASEAARGAARRGTDRWDRRTRVADESLRRFRSATASACGRPPRGSHRTAPRDRGGDRGALGRTRAAARGPWARRTGRAGRRARAVAL